MEESSVVRQSVYLAYSPLCKCSNWLIASGKDNIAFKKVRACVCVCVCACEEPQGTWPDKLPCPKIFSAAVNSA